ncbi:AraC family transcriptional regulator [Nannocystis sp. SCPEA4]|uniref:helix-turn-helix domain-containing protein n=1 Tax=Nannocystis sp. SCPEA4 TaxID=2996787 RepID=UPI002270CF64|nr:AraC family transcriptional regulator [Nannocystis sp. SCPEA4]MCY1054678.1 AraC family transcriptional regulator [Nannocystis sp. SCPEA4]
MDGCRTEVPEHAHDWPVLSLYVMGAYENRSALGVTRISSPSAMLYAAREAHANAIGRCGLEQIDIEFDPTWLKLRGRMDPGPVRCWIGGAVARAARGLAAIWSRAGAVEADLAGATAEFLRFALQSEATRRPVWLEAVEERLATQTPPTTTDLAHELGLNPGWLAQAYRAATGEGIGEAVRRKRVELATSLLRGSDAPAAEIAVAAGFCDQSHMIRVFRRLIGRTPAQVREEGLRRGPPRP